MLLAFWNADAGCRIHAFVQAQVSSFGKDRAERNLHQLVGYRQAIDSASVRGFGDRQARQIAAMVGPFAFVR
jgi:hypothetical protein